MTPSEEVRKRLDELGIEHYDYGHENHVWWCGADNVGWHAENRPSVNGSYVKIEAVLTPAQAIAATVGAGTCHNVGDERDFCCSECGVRMFIESDDTYTMIASDELTVIKRPNFCPNCGAKVVSE